MRNEAEIIQTLKIAFPQQIGDDAAVLHKNTHELTLISKDLLIENVHFNCRYMTAEDIAYKSLQVNLSDIAAMGGTPKQALLGIAIPDHYALDINTFLSSFIEICQQANITLIGGDTTASPNDFCISLTILGTVHPKNITYRHTAKPSNYFCVIGHMGFAHLGLQALESDKACDIRYTNALRRPQALVTEAQWLAQQIGVTAMMDISDGLAIDLLRLCEASQVSAHLDIQHLPQDRHFQQTCADLQQDPLITQLAGGEDYGLLCAIDAEQFATIHTAFCEKFTTPWHYLGQLHAHDHHTIYYFQNGSPIKLTLKPFSHFGEL